MAVVYPFNSARSARSGDPSTHELRAALDLFVLTVQQLSVRFGSPDFPSSQRVTPGEVRESSFGVVVWDFDYYKLVVDLCRCGDEPSELYQVQIRRIDSEGAFLSHRNARKILEQLANELKPLLGSSTAPDAPQALESATSAALYCAVADKPELNEPSVDGFLLRKLESSDSRTATLTGLLVRLDGSCEPAKLLVRLDDRARVSFLKIWLGDRTGRKYDLASWSHAMLPETSSEWRSSLEFQGLAN